MIQAIDHDQRLYGTVVFPKGNISKNLLQDGFARYVPWSGMAVLNRQELQLAAAQAKTNIAATSPYVEESRNQYDAVVVQVNSGDSVTIRGNDDVEKRVYLASVKAPRFGKKQGDKPEDYAFESREFLRRSLVGKKVVVQTEYVLQEKKKEKKASAEGVEEEEEKVEDIKTREYVTMFKGKFNIAAELLANGLADIVPTPRDAPRSLYLAELCSALIKAQTEKKHKWAIGKVPLQIKDLTPRSGQSKEANAINKANEVYVEEHFKKLNGSTVSAVLDAVYSPSRFRVFIPSTNTFFAVRLAAIQTPALEKDQPKPIVLDQALAALKKHVQMDIQLEVTHKAGLTLIANILNRETKENLAVSMVQQGQATIIAPAAEKNKYKKELLSSQDFAKKQRLGVWVDFDEQKEKEELERQKQEAQESVGTPVFTKDGDNFINVVVTDVSDPVHFYVNNVDDKNVELINEKMAQFDGSVAAPADFEPKNGDIVAGLFDSDNKWYRVRVESASKSRGNYEVQFIDFGNIELVPYAALRPLSAELSKLRQLARPCALSGLVAPHKTSEWFETGALSLAQLAVGCPFTARIDFTERSNGVLHLTLTEEGQTKTVNQRMLEEGLLLLNQRPGQALQRVFAELEEYEITARNAHKGLFEFGDYIVDTEIVEP